MANANKVSDMVAENPAYARVFDRLGVDYCCHGDQTLDHACITAGLDPDAVIAALETADPVVDDHECANMSVTGLIEHILCAHHIYLRRELPELIQLADKVARAHGERHPELDRVRTLVFEIEQDLEPHMLKEERVLFPAINQLIQGHCEFPFGSIRNPIAMMGLEHERVGLLLADLRATTNDYSVPDDACPSYRDLVERLANLEHDTHMHVFEENQLLFPRVIEIERHAS